MKRTYWLLIVCLGWCLSVAAQAPDTAGTEPGPAPAAKPKSGKGTPSKGSPAPASKPADSSGGGGGSSLLGKDLPFFNPGTEILE